MVDQRRPRVAVVGGFFNLDRSDAALGRDARVYAETLGAALAEAGFGLVVYFSDDLSLEPHVVRGFVAALTADVSEACIDVRYSEAQRGEVSFPEQAARPNLFTEDAFPGPNWEAPFYRSLASRNSVQAVLLMAGGQSTLNAGQVSVGHGLPLLAIDKYPGAAQLLRSELAIRQSGYPSAHSLTPSQLVDWLAKRQVEEAEKHRLVQLREVEYERLTSQRRAATWFAVALVALLATLAFGLLGTNNPRVLLVTMGAALVTAGATGALVRGLTTSTMKLDPWLAGLLGAAAGLVVGLAYLIPQLIGAPGMLDSSTNVIKATDKIQYLSVTLVAFGAGIGFDTIFRRIQQEAESAPVSVPR
jgi:hypothetical protein